MTRDQIIDEYFETLVGIVCGRRFIDDISYRKLLAHLHRTDFRWSIPMDGNRADQGKALRWRFAMIKGYEDIYEEVLTGPCSVLEMMVALAIQCEDSMEDARYGDRTAQWFWSMVVNLGLGPMTDDYYDSQYVTDVIERFLNREYEPDGAGGLFRLRHCKRDVREMEIWHQLCQYMDGFV